MNFLDIDSTLLQDTQPLPYSQYHQLMQLMDCMEYVTEEGVLIEINRNDE